MGLGYIGIALVILGAALVGFSILGYDFSLWLLAPGIIAVLIGASFLAGFREIIIRRLMGKAPRDQL